jgi:hypothetical protein
MSLVTFFVFLMALGFIVRARAVVMALLTKPGTIARAEAQCAIEAGGLIMILTAPWLVIAAIWLFLSNHL